MPKLQIVQLPNDHTWRQGRFSNAQALMADNDLALGRIVEAVLQSPFWRDTVIFVLEDDRKVAGHVELASFAVFGDFRRTTAPGTIPPVCHYTDVVAAIEDILAGSAVEIRLLQPIAGGDVFSETGGPFAVDAVIRK